MGNYSISDLAEMTGVKACTLRVWEKRYGMLKPRRTETNIRVFEDEDLTYLRQVVNLYRHGVKISHIAEMSPEELATRSTQITKEQQDFEAKLHQGLVNMSVTDMNAVLDDSIRVHGFESTILTLILPILEKMEVMWLNQEIDVAHETCFRELVKRKALREIESLPHHCGGQKVIMFLPPGNQQELDHLFMHYLVRKEGLCVTDMGNHVSLDCVCSALQKSNAECILMVNRDPAHWQFGSFVKKLTERTSLPIVIMGRETDEQWSQYGGQVVSLDSFDETRQFFGRLKENLQDLVSE